MTTQDADLIQCLVHQRAVTRVFDGQRASGAGEKGAEAARRAWNEQLTSEDWNEIRKRSGGGVPALDYGREIAPYAARLSTSAMVRATGLSRVTAG